MDERTENALRRVRRAVVRVREAQDSGDPQQVINAQRAQDEAECRALDAGASVIQVQQAAQ